MSTTLKMTITARPDPFRGDKARGFLTRETFTGSSVEEIAEKFCDWRDASGYGTSQIGGMNVVKRGRDRVAKISYNGRIWPIVE